MLITLWFWTEIWFLMSWHFLVKFSQFDDYCIDQFIMESFCSAGHPSGHPGGTRLGRLPRVEHGSVSSWESEVLHFKQRIINKRNKECMSSYCCAHWTDIHNFMLIIYFWHAGLWRLSTHPFFLWIQKQIQWRSSRPCQSLITRYIFRSLWVISPLNYVMFILSNFYIHYK